MFGFTRSSPTPPEAPAGTGATGPGTAAAGTTADGTAADGTAADGTDGAAAAGTAYPEARTDEHWRQTLTPQEYQVLRLAGTERAHTGEYTDNHEVGVYSCRACGTELFRSEEKFDSHCGWPSFYSALAGDRVEEIEDRSFGSVRTEVRCAACGSHMGHVFAGEGYGTPTDLRYCINSISMRFEKAAPTA